MKRRQILPLLFTILMIGVICGSTLAQDLTINAGGDRVSRYVWRGADINGQPNIQPYISFEYSGLQLGLWGSYGLTHLNSTDEYYAVGTEIDTWVGYSFALSNTVNVTATVTDYYYPNAGIGIGNFNNYYNMYEPGAHLVGVGGNLGKIMLGLFASSAVNPMVTTQGLLIGGSWEFLVKQTVSVIAVGAYCFIFTYFVLKLINYITPVKVTKQEEEAGMDASLHGEIAYED